GVKEYLMHKHNALLSPIRDIESLSNNVLLILRDLELRQKLIENGISFVKTYSWENIINQLEDIICQ
ncbi:MAG: hypothetical protein KAW87_08525, partial [Candidatus Cloacimonetes bacterium]|nr:hypothetical protein [Candidatus Cloacimonadota bacterium]